jgi:hypothetical protein
VKKDNPNWVFQFLNRLYDLIANGDENRKKLLLKFYLLPLALYSNSENESHYLTTMKTCHPKEVLLKKFLINFNDFFKKNYQTNTFTFDMDMGMCKSLLNNLTLNKDVKLLFLKFIENFLRSSTDVNCKNLIFMYVCDYYELDCELTGNLLGIFRFYLNAASCYGSDQVSVVSFFFFDKHTRF